MIKNKHKNVLRKLEFNSFFFQKEKLENSKSFREEIENVFFSISLN